MSDMSKNTAVEIRAVANGFVVSPGYIITRNGTYCDSEVLVFQSFAGLTAWLAEHFDHRAKGVKLDAEG